MCTVIFCLVAVLISGMSGGLADEVQLQMPAWIEIHYVSVNIQTARVVWLAEQSSALELKHLERELQLAFPCPVDSVSASAPQCNRLVSIYDP